MRRFLPVVCAALVTSLVASVCPTPLAAQPLEHFTALRLRPGQVVRIDLRSGERLTGALVTVTDDTLGVRREADASRLPYAVVPEGPRRIAVRRTHGKLGAAVGAGAIGVFVLVSECLSNRENRECDFDIPLILGGGAGALIGRMVHTWHVVYEDRR